MARVLVLVREVVCIFASSVWPTTLAERWSLGRQSPRGKRFAIFMRSIETWNAASGSEEPIARREPRKAEKWQQSRPNAQRSTLNAQRSTLARRTGSWLRRLRVENWWLIVTCLTLHLALSVRTRRGENLGPGIRGSVYQPSTLSH